MLQRACSLWLPRSPGARAADPPGARFGSGIHESVWGCRQAELRVWIPAGELGVSVMFISPALLVYSSLEMQPKSRRCADSVLYLSSSELIMDLEKWVITLGIKIKRGCCWKTVLLCPWPNGSPLNCLPLSSQPSSPAARFGGFPGWLSHLPWSGEQPDKEQRSSECRMCGACNCAGSWRLVFGPR